MGRQSARRRRSQRTSSLNARQKISPAGNLLRERGAVYRRLVCQLASFICRARALGFLRSQTIELDTVESKNLTPKPGLTSSLVLERTLDHFRSDSAASWQLVWGKEIGLTWRIPLCDRQQTSMHQQLNQIIYIFLRLSVPINKWWGRKKWHKLTGNDECMKYYTSQKKVCCMITLCLACLTS